MYQANRYSIDKRTSLVRGNDIDLILRPYSYGHLENVWDNFNDKKLKQALFHKEEANQKYKDN